MHLLNRIMNEPLYFWGLSVCIKIYSQSRLNELDQRIIKEVRGGGYKLEMYIEPSLSYVLSYWDGG